MKLSDLDGLKLLDQILHSDFTNIPYSRKTFHQKKVLQLWMGEDFQNRSRHFFHLSRLRRLKVTLNNSLPDH